VAEPLAVHQLSTFGEIVDMYVALNSHRFCAGVLLAASCLLLASGMGCSSKGDAHGSTAGNPLAANSLNSSPESGGQSLCSLLTDSEVREAIGPHGAGSNDVGNEWGLQGCRWTATTAQKVDGFPNGWFDAIEVAVFDKDRESWAREQAKGEPEKSFKKGSLFDSNYGELWFDCGRDRFCVVKAHTASGEKREQVALQVAKLVDSRLR
jgi:hypothetical protein